MAEPIIIKDQKFTKVNGVWVDQKKTPAPKDLIPILNKLEASYMTAPAPPPLPIVPKQAEQKSDTKTELILNKLVASIDKLTKSIERLNSTETKQEQQVAKRVSAPEKIPSLLGAIGLNTKEFFAGKKDEYGRVTQPGLVRQLISTVAAPSRLLFAAQDRRREAIAQQKMRAEENQQPNSSSNQVLGSTNGKGEAEEKLTMASGSESKYAAKEFTEEKVQPVMLVDINDSAIKKLMEVFGKKEDKKKDDELPKGGLLGGFLNALGAFGKRFINIFGRGRAGGGRRPRSGAEGAKETAKLAEKEVGEAGAKETAKLAEKEVGEAGAKETAKLAEKEAIEVGGKKVVQNSAGNWVEQGTNKFVSKGIAEEAEKLTEATAKATSTPRIFPKIFGGGTKVTAEAASTPRIFPKIFGGGAKVAGEAASKPGIFSKLLGGSGKKAAEVAAAKTGGKLLGRIAGSFIPGVGGALDLASAESAAKEGNPLAASLYGAASGLNFGGAVADVTGLGVIPGAIADVGGGLLTTAAVASEVTGFGKSKAPAKIAPNPGLAPQTQALNLSTRRVMQEKEKKMTAGAPVVTNISSPSTTIMNNNQTIVGPTMGPRGSLDMETYRTRGI